MTGVFFSLFFSLLFGLLPGFIWLVFFLKKDPHREPKKLILKIFLMGIFAGILAIPGEYLLWKIFSLLKINLLKEILYLFLGVALLEECLKYLAVKRKYFLLRESFFSERDFDEPIDASIYLITSGLGFATLENLLLFFSKKFLPEEMFVLSGFRFIGATLLHALCSGLIGYFLALYFLKGKNKKIIIGEGIFLASLIHGFYNFFILKLKGFFRFLFPFFILLLTLVFLLRGLWKLKKMRSLCKIE